MHGTKWVPDRKKWAKNVLVHLRFLRNQKNTICGKLSVPPQAGGEMSLNDLGWIRWKSWERKLAEMGRFFASEWLREPGAQQMLVNKATPFLKKGIDQLSTAIRPKKRL